MEKRVEASPYSEEALVSNTTNSQYRTIVVAGVSLKVVTLKFEIFV